MSFRLPQSVTEANALQIEKEGMRDIALLQTIDCSALTDFDSTVLTVLLAWQKKLQEDGLRLSVERVPEKLKVLASVYGVSALLGL